MHIAEGILPAQWAVTWYGVASLALARGLRELKRKERETPGFRPMLGLMGAAIFIISLLPVPVPVAGTSAHAAGTPLAAILLGPWISTLVAAASLLLQALFFAHGGLTTWGANILSEGLVGSMVAYGIFRFLRGRGLSLVTSAAAAGFLGDLAVYLTTSLELALALHGSKPVLPVMAAIFAAYLPAQGPLAVGEAVLTAGILHYILGHRPDILHNLGVVGGVLPGGKEEPV